MLLIREERKKRNWTQTYVAEKIGATLSTVQKIETEIRRPSFEVIVKLENLFGMNYRKLFNLPPLEGEDT